MANYCRIPAARRPANDRDDDCDFIIRTRTDEEKGGVLIALFARSHTHTHMRWGPFSR